MTAIDTFKIHAQDIYFPNRGVGLEGPDLLSAVETAYKRNTLDMVNVKDFGVKGDGSTDDRDAINTALEKVSLGGAIVFPKGNYYVSNTITVFGKNVMVISNGAKIFTDQYLDPVISVSGENITVCGFEIDGGEIAARGITIEPESKNVIIDNCDIHGFNQSDGQTTIPACIHFTGESENIEIRNCKIHNVYAYPDGVEGNTAGAARGIHFQMLDSQTKVTQNISIHHCFFTDIETREDGDAIHFGNRKSTMDQPLNAVVHNNIFVDVSKRCVKAQADGVNIHSNIVRHSIERDESTPSGVEIARSAFSIFGGKSSVSNNLIIIEGSGGMSYPIDIGAGDEMFITHDVVVSGNIIVNGNPDEEARAGIYTNGPNVNQIAIFGNTVRGNFADGGIHIAGGISNVTIQGNTVASSKYGITVKRIWSSQTQFSSPKNFVISGNVMQDISDYAIFISDGSNGVVVGNIGEDESAFEFITIEGDADGDTIVTVGNVSTRSDSANRFNNIIHRGLTLQTPDGSKMYRLFIDNDGNPSTEEV